MADLDVVVVGAGLSGLSCARALKRAGARVMVLEAAPRVGGRTLSERIGEATFDLGGQWVGPRQARVLSLLSEAGLATFRTFDEGKKVLEVRGRTSTYKGTIPSVAPWKLLELHLALRTLDKHTARVPLGRGHAMPDAARLDDHTVQAFAESQVRSRTVRALLAAAARVVFGAELREIGLLWFLHYLRAGGGLLSLTSIEGGAQEKRVVEGMQSMSLFLARGLDVQLGEPVRQLAQDASGVRVVSDVGAYRARFAVLAVPPALVGRIAFDPALPAERDQLYQRFPMGATVKCLATYDAPFWRRKGLSGEVVCPEGPATVVFDNTSQDGREPALLAFVVGDHARTWHLRPPELRKRELLTAFSRWLGKEALEPRLYVEKNWSEEPFVRGCPTGNLGPGVLSQLGDGLRAPVGRLHFAGTETAREWTGYLEGAIEAGERAAQEIEERLR